MVIFAESQDNPSCKILNKLKLVQNFAARIILGLRKCDHISAGLRLKEIAANALLTFNLKDFAFYKTIVIADCSETYRRIVKSIISKLSTYNGWVKDL